MLDLETEEDSVSEEENRLESVEEVEFEGKWREALDLVVVALWFCIHFSIMIARLRLSMSSSTCGAMLFLLWRKESSASRRSVSSMER